MTVPVGLERFVSIDPEVVGGEPCFTNTRVPLETVVDNLAAGISVERILRNYPSLEAKHVEAVLRWEGNLARLAPKSVIDRNLAEGLLDLKEGRTLGPYDSASEAIAGLEENSSLYKALCQ